MAVCLVTGGAGFIGSHIAERLVEQGHRVRILDNLSTGKEQNIAAFKADVELIRGDICDESSFSAFKGVDWVFHQAALASVPLSLEKPHETHRVCVTGTVNVLRASVAAGVKRLMYAASSSAYGDQPTSAKRESDLPLPLSPYATAKLSGEFYCQAFYHSFGLETVAIRYFNVFGPRQDPNSPYSAVIPLFVTRILSGNKPIIYGNGLQSRDFTFVKNVVEGNMLAATAPNVAGRVINVADGRQTTLLRLLELLSEMLGKSVAADFQPPRVGDVRESLADISVARKLLGYEPLFTLEQGLRQTIDYYVQLVKASKA
jgi:UDP-glucose 4-epimerase